MIMNREPYPISFEQQLSQVLTCRYGEELRQYKMKPDIDVSGLSCLLQIAKPDGTFTENGVDVITEEEECYLILTIPKQATVVKGVAKYSICCYGEIETEMHLLYSAEGPLWVDDDLITDEMIQSVAEVNGYTFPQDFFTTDMIPEISEQIAAVVKSEILDDDITSETTTWSSTKIYDEITQAAGATALGDLSDVSITDPEEGDILVYDDEAETWKNAEIPGHVYSTSEHIVGKWIDGKTVYEKTLTIPWAAATETSIPHDITDFGELIDVFGKLVYNSQYIPIPYVSTNVLYNIGVGNANATKIDIGVGGGFSGGVSDIALTMRYTKTS